MDNLKQWDEIKDQYKNSSLIIGNGASIAIDSLFNYHSLYDRACEENLINNDLKNIFSAFETKDFETR